jgi:hypothetical protein
MEAAAGTTEGFCPHCQLLVEKSVAEPWPREPTRCPHCHLLIGVGRGQSEASLEPGNKGTAAGVFSRQAKRDGAGPTAAPERVIEGIREAARQIGERPERLLMVDYQQIAAADPDLPPLSDIFAAYGSWKAARREAAT